MQIRDHHHALQPDHRRAPPTDLKSIRTSWPSDFRTSPREPGEHGQVEKIQTALLGSFTPVSTRNPLEYAAISVSPRWRGR